MSPSRLLFFNFLLLCSICVLLPSCGPTEPSKEIMISNLRTLLAADQSDAENEIDMWVIPRTTKDLQSFFDQVKEPLSSEYLSKAGIDVLEEKGTFGQLGLVYPESGPRWMKRFGILDATACYGIQYRGAEVAGLWQEGSFKFFRMDDAGDDLVD